jgi:protocatechuate 3,4-dioxygenase, beta subunit
MSPSIVRTLKILLLSVVALVGTRLITSDSLAQADPSWLRSWNEAVANRPDSMSSSGRVAPEDEPGIPMVIEGRVVDPDGSAAGGVVVHVYHRDQDGFDFGPGDNALTTWRLQGWVKTDGDGRFRLQTIRPGTDHMGREGAHIHITLESDDYGRQWAPTVFLSDDPLLTETQRRRSREAGEFGWVREVRTTDGVQYVSVNLQLKERADF